jgi:hypothetical protein
MWQLNYLKLSVLLGWYIVKYRKHLFGFEPAALRYAQQL